MRTRWSTTTSLKGHCQAIVQTAFCFTQTTCDKKKDRRLDVHTIRYSGSTAPFMTRCCALFFFDQRCCALVLERGGGSGTGLPWLGWTCNDSGRYGASWKVPRWLARPAIKWHPAPFRVANNDSLTNVGIAAGSISRHANAQAKFHYTPYCVSR